MQSKGQGSSVAAIVVGVSLLAPCAHAQVKSAYQVVPYTPITVEQARSLEAEALAAVNKDRSEKRKLFHFNQAQDNQLLLVVRRSDAKNTLAIYTVASEDPHNWGTLDPADDVQSLTVGKFEKAGGALVGKAYVKSAVPSLKLAGGWSPNSVFIQKVGNVWSAMIDGNRPLAVTRYDYANLGNPTDYPEAARWDWERDPLRPIEPNTVVMGFPCARAWCLVGTLLPPTKNDPLDPDQAGNGGLHHGRRVPGWFDRAIDPNDLSKTVWIYPDKGLELLQSPGAFTGSYQPVAQIVGASIIDEPVGIQYFPPSPLAKEKWYAQFRGKSKEIMWNQKNGHTPFAVRWVSAIAPSFRAGDTSEIWVRCANGCCDASLEF
ncbi:MAG: hypothetical protein JWM95_174 [Gemmatimonadetes bacterium]|nr:hypothetical protein [Gemmatimonadota bacterium]